MSRFVSGSLLILVLAGCSAPRAYSTQGVAAAYGKGTELQTMTNLHPDEVRGRLYSVNYQQDGLIPVCSRVRIDEVNDIDLHFTVVDTGRRYHYIFHRAMREPLVRHLEKYFGTCGEQHMAGLSEADQWGIRNGQAKPGMSRRGVVLAIGYPPDHATASLEMDVWRYWRNRFKTFLVKFDGDLVASVGEPPASDRAGAPGPPMEEPEQ